MKLSLVTVFGLVLCSYAAPFRTIADIEALIEREYEIADRSEWVEINARTGPFKKLEESEKPAAIAFIAAHQRAVQDATEHSHQTKTFASDKNFHLDRQQPTNQHGDHKVALQVNRPKNERGPTTIGQVVVNKDDHVSSKTVAANLKHSVNTGKEVTAPRNGKAARKAANDAKHKAKMENNKNYAEAKRKAGERKGKFRKGNK